jgi:hypothetical protein
MGEAGPGSRQPDRLLPGRPEIVAEKQTTAFIDKNIRYH